MKTGYYSIFCLNYTSDILKLCVDFDLSQPERNGAAGVAYILFGFVFVVHFCSHQHS